MQSNEQFTSLGTPHGLKPNDQVVIDHLTVVSVDGPRNRAMVRWGEVEFEVPLGALRLPA